MAKALADMRLVSSWRAILKKIGIKREVRGEGTSTWPWMNRGDDISMVQSHSGSKHAVLPSSLFCSMEKAKPEGISGVPKAGKQPAFSRQKTCPCSGERHHGPAGTTSDQSTANVAHQYKHHLEKTALGSTPRRHNGPESSSLSLAHLLSVSVISV